jgi:hypothetical protein
MSTGTGSESADGARPDGAHLDEDAECLEDPVHCGDARHQHDAHVLSSAAPPATPAPTAAAGDTAGETAQP